MELYPGVKISIGPPIDDGFYYDFEFPEGVTLSDADFERIEAKMREHVKADEPFVREDVPVAEAIERFRAEDQPYKVELIEDLVRDQGVETVSLYTQRPVHRPLPRPARAVHQADQGVQAHQRRRRLLARRRRATRCSRASTARRSSPRRTWPSTSSASSRRAPATTASSAASSTCSCSASCRRARRSGSRPAPQVWTQLDRLLAHGERRPRLRGGAHADPLRRRAVEAVRATGTCTATTCTSPTSRTGRWASSP